MLRGAGVRGVVEVAADGVERLRGDELVDLLEVPALEDLGLDVHVRNLVATSDQSSDGPHEPPLVLLPGLEVEVGWSVQEQEEVLVRFLPPAGFGEGRGSILGRPAASGPGVAPRSFSSGRHNLAPGVPQTRWCEWRPRRRRRQGPRVGGRSPSAEDAGLPRPGLLIPSRPKNGGHGGPPQPRLRGDVVTSLLGPAACAVAPGPKFREC